MPVANGMPLAAIGAREEVPPCCVTVISANACRQVAPAAETVLCGKATARCAWTQRTPPIWSHSPQCAECDHVGGRVWVGRVRRRRWTQYCGIERGRFRRMPDGDHRTRRETSQRTALAKTRAGEHANRPTHPTRNRTGNASSYSY